MRVLDSLRRRRRERDLEDEITSHLEMAVRDRVAAGEDPREARFASLREFGNVTHTREDTRSSWGGRWLEWAFAVLGDVRYAVRLLTRAPAYSIVVIAVLALGIGANIVAFGYYRALALAPLPGVDGSARLHAVGTTTKGGDAEALSYDDYKYIRDRARSYEGLAGSNFDPLTLGRGTEARRVYGELVTGNYFPMLRVGAHHGRTLLPTDDVTPRRHPVVVLSYSLWQRQFDGDPSVVGRIIHLNNVPLTVVGIAAQDFHGSVVGLDIDLFVTVMMQPVLSGGWDALANPQAPLLFGLGRPRRGVDLEQARSELRLIGAQLAAHRPASELRERAMALPIRESPQGLQTYGGPLVGLLGITAILLLIVVCANVAGLVLVRTLGRRGEIAARLALGATRARITRLLLIESLILAIPGAWLGLQMPGTVHWYLVEWRSLVSAPIYVDLDAGSMVVVAVVLACASALLSGLMPGLSASRVDLAASMNDGLSPRGPASSRLRSGLVICQVAMALILMVGAALVVRSLSAARKADPGFDPRNVASVVIDVRAAGYDAPQGWNFYRRLQDDVRAMEGVESVSVMWLPLLMVWDFGGREFIPEGHSRTPDDNLRFGFNIVGADHFRLLRIPLLAGREFLPDESTARVAVINETFARRFWGAPAAALGKRIQSPDWLTGAPMSMTVVGVARDIKYARLSEPARPYVYLPHAQAYTPTMAIHVRSAGPATTLIERVRRHIRSADSNVPVLEAEMLEAQTRLSFAMYEVAARVLRVVGVVAVLLAALGIYGLVAYTVKQSAHEIGIRMAIGARQADIVRRYVRSGLWLALAGAAIGIAVSLAVGRVMTVLLFGVSPHDARSLAAATALVVSAATAAALVPAWRAAHVDPLISLRRH